MRHLLTILALLASSVALGEPVKVAVLPFDEVGNDSANPKLNWVTKAIGQSWLMSLQVPGVDVVSATPTTQPTGARFVVGGTLQRVDGQLRVTGQVADTVANKAAGGFKATGSDANCFLWKIRSPSR